MQNFLVLARFLFSPVFTQTSNSFILDAETTETIQSKYTVELPPSPPLLCRLLWAMWGRNPKIPPPLAISPFPPPLVAPRGRRQLSRAMPVKGRRDLCLSALSRWLWRRAAMMGPSWWSKNDRQVGKPQEKVLMNIATIFPSVINPVGERQTTEGDAH
jgi:hypothetical protein